MVSLNKNELYTKFCIGVELGDDTLVRQLMQQGADPTIPYGVDGVLTTPIRSALSKGDLPMILTLLNSRFVRVKLADIDNSPKIKRDLITPLLVRRLGDSLEKDCRDTLMRRSFPSSSSSAKVSLSTVLGRGLTEKVSVTVPQPPSSSSSDSEEDSQPHASSSDKVRCPPGDSCNPTSPTTTGVENEDEDEDDAEEEEEEEDDAENTTTTTETDEEDEAEEEE